MAEQLCIFRITNYLTTSTLFVTHFGFSDIRVTWNELHLHHYQCIRYVEHMQNLVKQSSAFDLCPSSWILTEYDDLWLVLSLFMSVLVTF